MILQTLSSESTIQIGDDTGISDGSFCAARRILIGDNCLLGADVIISDTDLHPITSQGRRHAALSNASTRPVLIGNNVFIGARTIVLKGVEIGSHSVIGAGSVVTKSIPEQMIVVRNPCRIIRPVD